MKDPKDARQLAEIIKRDRVFEFLAGLSPEFDEVNDRIIGKELLFFLEESFSYVSSKEDKKVVLTRTVLADVLALKKEFKNINTFNRGQFRNPNRKGEIDS